MFSYLSDGKHSMYSRLTAAGLTGGHNQVAGWSFAPSGVLYSGHILYPSVTGGQLSVEIVSRGTTAYFK